MTPTNQTKFSAFTSKGERITYGNCLVACIASVLDVDIHEVPNLYTLYGITRPQPPDAVDTPYWAEVLNMWMRDKHGKELEIMTAIAYASRVTKDPNYPRTAIVKGMSHRDKPHCCIYHLSTLVWDPHPSREGLKEMKHVYVIKTLVDAPVKQTLPEFTIDHDKIEHYALYGKGEFPLDPAQKTALEVEQMQKERESVIDHATKAALEVRVMENDPICKIKPNEVQTALSNRTITITEAMVISRLGMSIEEFVNKESNTITGDVKDLPEKLYFVVNGEKVEAKEVDDKSWHTTDGRKVCKDTYLKTGQVKFVPLIDPLQAIEERKKALAELHEEEDRNKNLKTSESVKVVIDGKEETVFVGDTIITKGYTEDYDGKELTITSIFDRDYCHFTPHTKSTHNFGKADIVKIVRRKGE